MTASTADRFQNGFFSTLVPRFAGYFLVAVTVVIATFISLEYRQFHIEQDNRLKQESLRLQLASKIIVHDLKHIIVDLLNIADLDWIRAYAKTDSRHSRMQLERFFLNLASNEGLYDQIRFIDKSGYEKIRVNYKNGVAYTSTTEQLQDKSSTYYFREALKLAPGEVFVSPLDLNVEHGKVEQPYRPTLRVATTVFDSSGNLAGVVVLNYMARLVREEFEKIMLNSWGQPMLLNADGFWLYSPVAGDEWGFVLEHNANFSKRFPAAWKNIKSRDAGFLQTDKGLFVFNTLDPVRQVRTDDAEHIGIKQTEQSINHWKLLTYVPLQSAIFGPFDSLHSRPILVAALIVFSAIASLLLAIFRTRNIVYTRQLRESELRTRLLLDSVGEGIFGVDSSGTCTFINPRALTLLGYQDASDLIHKPIHQLIHHTSPDGLPCREEECKLYSAFHKQGSFHVESEWMWRKDGTSFPVEYRSTPIVENGRTLGAVAVFNDITSRKMADDALRRSHEELETRVSERTAELEATNTQLKNEINERENTQHALIQERNFVSAILSTVGALVIVMDTRGRIVRFNKACEQVTGYRFEDLQDEYIWDYLIPKEQVESVKNVFNKLTAGDFPSYYKNHWVTKAGRYRMISWSNTALVDPGTHKVEYVIATGLDITEQDQAEQALRDRENQLRLITDNLPVLIAYLDADGRYRFNNRAYEEWFGVSREQIYGRHIKEVIGETAYLAFRDKVDKVLSGIEVHFETVAQYKTAGERFIDATYIPDTNDDGEVAGFYVLIQDVTARKQAEERARQHQEQVAHITRVNMMGELATELAHELNQPLTAIQSYAETAFYMLNVQGQAVSGEDIGTAVDGIRSQAERAGKIISHLREFVRKRPVEKTAIDLRHLVHNVLELTEPELKRHGITLNLIDDPQLPLVNADNIQLEQVLFNIVRNSIQAMASSSTNQRELTVRSHHYDNEVLIEMTDTGPGMDADTLKDVFKPFVSTKGAAGMGMGLSICRSIMEAHHGEIWAESEPGHGATFYIKLPVDDEAAMSDNTDGQLVVSETEN